jgi:Flp pilus assembly protein CpaB
LPIRQRISAPYAGAVLAVIALAVGVAVVVSNQEGTPSSQVEAEDARGQRWRIQLAAAPDDATVGATIELELSITNLSEGLQTISFSTNRQIELLVRDEDGKVVWRSEEPSASVTVSRSPGPGQPIVYQRAWATTSAARGRYTVEGSILARELEGRGETATSVVLR